MFTDCTKKEPTKARNKSRSRCEPVLGPWARAVGSRRGWSLVSLLMITLSCVIVVECVQDAARVQHELVQSASQASQANSYLQHATKLLNVSQTLLEKFHFVFQESPNLEQHQQQPDGLLLTQSPSYVMGDVEGDKQQRPDQIAEFTRLTSSPVRSAIALAEVVANHSLNSGSSGLGQQRQQQTSLETRTNLFGSQYNLASSIQQQQQRTDEFGNKNFIRILNKVFSRVELPGPFRRQAITGDSLIQSHHQSQQSSGGSTASSSASSLCTNHIGCIADLPNFPIILKLKPNVSTTFTVYTNTRGSRQGQRIMYEPLMHYQLQDEFELASSSHPSVSNSSVPDPIVRLYNRNRRVPATLRSFQALPLSATAANGTATGSQLASANRRRRIQLANAKAAAAAAAVAAVARDRFRQQHAERRLATTSSGWLSGANKIVHSRELPFDMSALEQCGFNASLTTRIIIGGYFAKEEEEWIEELVRQWLLLEPSNVIKVSWQDSNRGLYHSAAYNSRIVGRQLSLFLHYLDELFHIDPRRFHLVGHSLGAHIAGFAGADLEGQLARITGLDPAGPIFVELNAAHRLDPSDAQFVDVVHTNGGTITKGALGLHTPSGHVDYYPNGGSLQPGCFFSSVSMSIMDPVERIACNHRRSYRYFTEIIKLAIRVGTEKPTGRPRASGNAAELRHFPQAFLFEVARNDDLTRMVQPDVKLNHRLLHHGSGPPCTLGNESQSSAGVVLGSMPASEPMATDFGDSNDLNSVSLTSYAASSLNQPLESRANPELARAETRHRTLMGSCSEISASAPTTDGEESPPARKVIEFHSLNPSFPSSQRGLYYFRTRQEAPFFGSKQYALRLGLEAPFKRKITLSIKINTTLVAELELDELDEARPLVFVLQNPALIDHANLFSGRSSRAPDLWLMWRQRSFNLLLAHQSSELHLNELELNLLDDNERHEEEEEEEEEEISVGYERRQEDGQQESKQPAPEASGRNGTHARDNDTGGGPGQRLASTGGTRRSSFIIIRYEPNLVNNNVRGAENFRSRIQQQQQQQHSNAREGNASAGFVLVRNHWHKFDGRPVAVLV